MDKKRKLWTFFILVFFAGSFLRLFRIGSLCFWCDEFLAISYGWQPLKWMVNYITFHDAHPPLFYAIVHFLLKYGTSEAFLRLLPAFFGILSIPLAYMVGKEFKDERTGIIFSTLLSLNPAFILWSRILKSYSMFTFFLLLSFYLFIKIALKSEKKFKYIILLFISDIILLYLHNFAFIWILIEFCFLISGKKFNKKWLFYYLALFLFYLPWLIRIPYQLKFTLGVVRPFPVIFRYFYLFFYFFFGETLYPLNFYLIIPFLIVLLLIFARALIEFLSLDFPKRTILLSGIFIPLFLVPFPSTVPQNLLPFSIFTFLFLSLQRKKISEFLFIAFFVLTSFSIYFYFTKSTKNFHDVSKIIPYREINTIFSNYLDKNCIIFSNEKRQFFTNKHFSAFDYYYKGKAKVIEAKKNLIDFKKIEKISSRHKRIGLFLNYNENPVWCDKLKKFFFKNYTLIYQKKFLYNEKLLSRLKGKRVYYWFIEVYIFEKKGK